MDKEILKYICESLCSLSLIPAKLYEEKELIASFEQHEANFDLVKPYINQLFDSLHPINYVITPDFLMFGYIRVNSSAYSILIGPNHVMNITEKAAKRIAIDLGISPSQIKDLSDYINGLPIMPLDNFMLLLSNIHASVNHEILRVTQFYTIGTESYIQFENNIQIESEVSKNMLKVNDQKLYGTLERRDNHSFETEMLFYIKHGMTKQLKNINYSTLNIRTGTLALNSFRHYKNAMIILNTLSLRAAIAGGLNPDTCYQLGEIYINKIEFCETLKQLSDIAKNLPVDYCERVHELNCPNTDNPAINKAIYYIAEHINQRITAAEIADLLCISREYLSVIFKQATNISLPQYINEQKVLEAQRLLKFTNYSLAEISNYLGFSSQSYFQNIFKKVVGVTPFIYRNHSD